MLTRNSLPNDYLMERPVFCFFSACDPVDSEGRPLMEWASSHQLLRGRTTKCTYSDFRGLAGKPINIDALTAFAQHKGQIQDALREMDHSEFLWSMDLNSNTLSSKLEVSLAQVRQLCWLACQRVIATTAMQVLVSHYDESNTKLASDLFSLQKIIRGINEVVEVSYTMGSGLDALEAFRSGELLYEFAAHHRLLEGSVEVCAASPRTLKSFLNFFLNESVIGVTHKRDVARLNDRRITTNHDQHFKLESDLTVLARFVLFLYEFTRVVVLVNSGKYKNEEVKNRQTFRYSNFAHLVAKMSHPLEKNHLRIYKAIASEFPVYSWQTKVRLANYWRAMELVCEASQSYASTSTELQWRDFQTKTLDNLNFVNLFWCKRIRMAEKPIDLIDLRTFFGPDL
jgi:hypothetical protein